MIIGLTYDLRQEYLAQGFSEEETAEFDRVDTIEAIEQVLQEIGYQTERIGSSRSLVGKLAAGQRWDMVFNICEGMYGLGREALVPALLDAYSIPYTFSDPVVLSLSLHKGLTKHVIRDLGIKTPDFAIIEQEADLAKIALKYPLFAKPIGEGTGKGIGPHSKCDNFDALKSICLQLLERYRQPVLVERYLSGREFTVGLVGTGQAAEAIGVIEVVLQETAEQHAYSYTNKEKCEELIHYKLVTGNVARQCADLALKAWRGLFCRDAGRVDVRFDEFGMANFLEVNPLAGLHPAHSDLPIICSLTGVSYFELISKIMASARDRLR